MAQVLADLQIASFGQTLHLVDAGCRDMRLCSLVDIVQPFLEVMAGLMEQQTKVSPARLSRTEIHTLGAQLQEALSIFDNSGLPNALGHLDFNPGNILVSGNHCVFLDWAEACAGHPFVTFQYLLEHLRRLCPVSESWEPRLLSAYTAKWRFFVEPKALTETIAVARLLAPFTYAIAGGAWREPTHLVLSGHREASAQPDSPHEE